MMIRISFHIKSICVTNYKYENTHVPIPNVGDIIIFSKSEIEHCFYGYNTPEYYDPLFQFTVESIDYIYQEENICVYINLLKYNRVKDKSNSVGTYNRI